VLNPRLLAEASPVLPSGDSFAIPREPLHQKLAPVVQFSLLFLLFTAAGTSLLMIGRQVGEVPAAATVPVAVDPTIAVPTLPAQAVRTAASPQTLSAADLALNPNRTDSDVATAVSNVDRAPRAAEEAPTTPTPTSPAAVEAPAAPYPTTNFSPSKFPEPIKQVLPRLQTIDPPPSVARLRGDIEEVRSR
jgi:hypothetical protein